MNIAEIERKLMAAARLNPPSERVPYAFEKRILARLASQPRLDYWAQWNQALWRAAAPCVALMLLLSAWSWWTPSAGMADEDWSDDFENTVLAVVDQEPAAEPLW